MPKTLQLPTKNIQSTGHLQFARPTTVLKTPTSDEGQSAGQTAVLPMVELDEAAASPITPGPLKPGSKKRASGWRKNIVLTVVTILTLLLGGGYLAKSYLVTPSGGFTFLPNGDNGLPFSSHSDQPCSPTTNASGQITPCGTPESMNPSSHAGQAGAMTTFNLAQIGSGIELSNPMRGPQYYGDENPPPGWPLTDRYSRFCWSDIESGQGQYNFSTIDEGMAEAAAAGYTYGFRVMPILPGNSCLPGYLSNTSVNDSFYLQRAQALFSALGARYNNDPRLGFVDMSLYGCWGEWNEACGGTEMSAENRKKLIDIQVQALSNKLFLMLTDKPDSLDYALSLNRAKPIGVRIDCLGYDELGGGRRVLDGDSLVSNRWKVAPLYFEYCSGPNFPQAANDIRNYHASLIGDGAGNISAFGSLGSGDQSAMMQGYSISGYRIVLNNLSIPSTIPAGANFAVNTHWSNTNVAPPYRGWNVMVQLRNGSGNIVWQDTSSTNLRKLLPGSMDAHDQFKLPGNIAAGTYTVTVQVKDAEGYYKPLQLANAGRQGDGSYRLGTITVTH